MLPQGQKILETTGKKYTGWTITSYGPFPSKSLLRKTWMMENSLHLRMSDKGTKQRQYYFGAPRWCNGKEYACECRRHKRCRFDLSVGNSPGGGNGNPLQYPCLRNPMDRGARQATSPLSHKE